jgi:hypothetical protein
LRKTRPTEFEHCLQRDHMTGSYYAIHQNHHRLRGYRIIDINGQLGRAGATWFLIVLAFKADVPDPRSLWLRRDRLIAFCNNARAKVVGPANQ